MQAVKLCHGIIRKANGEELKGTLGYFIRKKLCSPPRLYHLNIEWNHI
jgi:hypothetical protein